MEIRQERCSNAELEYTNNNRRGNTMKRTLGTAILLMSLATASAEYNPDWWKGLALEPTPTNDLVNATTVLEQQEDVRGCCIGNKPMDHAGCTAWRHTE